MNRHLLIIFLYCFIYSSIYGIELKKRDAYDKWVPPDCVFPFTFNLVTYNDCTTADGSNGDTPWCSYTSDYVGQFGYCEYYRNSSLTCADPYSVNGVTYHGCQLLSKTSAYTQCKTNDPDTTIKYCPEVDIPDTPYTPVKHLDNCDPTYKDLAPYHTMCFGPAPNAIVIPINDTEKQQIVDKHNYYRGNVSSEYMFKLYWDDELAKLAQARSNLCVFDHDLATNRISPLFYWLNGQNMVMATDIRTPSATLLDVMFKSEKPNFQYGSACKGNSGSCLHYTQLMLKDMTRVGCGHTHCLYADRIERFFTCNFIHSQYTNSSKYPFTPTTGPGVHCKSRSGYLCDCGNKICNYSNYERIYPDTCECGAATDDGPFHKREEAIENSGYGSDGVVEADLPGARIEFTPDGEPIVTRGLHNIRKRQPRKYSGFAGNGNNERITMFVR